MSTENMDMDEILASSDPDAIDALLDRLDDEDADETVTTGEQQPGTGGAGDDQQQTTEPGTGAEPGANGAQQIAAPAAAALPAAGDSALPAPAPIQGKSSDNTIPYSVLENERLARQAAQQQTQQLQQQVEQLSQQVGGAGKLERQLDVLTKQLENNGLEPDSLPEDFKLTDEKRQELMDDFGDAGKMIVAMHDQMNAQAPVAAVSAEPVQQPAVDDPVMAAIGKNSDLNGWMNGSTDADKERWNFAVTVDQRLQQDPRFADPSTLDARFAEAARLTQQTFGDAAQTGPTGDDQKLEQAISAAQTDTGPPASLSHMGNAETAQEPTLIDRLTSMDHGSMEDAVAGMNEVQLDALFEAM